MMLNLLNCVEMLQAMPLLTSAWTESIEAWGGTLWNIARVCIGLGFVIFVHELGHFLAAKFFGVKCEKFYVGFDVPISLGPIRLPAKLFHFQWGETEYGIGSIPLGGYVKMLGQDDDPRRMEEENARIKTAGGDAEAVGRAQYDPRSFPAKNVFARMVIISAGVVMNIIFGIIFAAIAFRIGVPYETTTIGEVLAGDPAWQAGLKSGDQIVQVADMKKPDSQLTFRDMRESIMMAGLDNPMEPIPVVVDREGTQKEFKIIGTTRHEPEKKSKLISLGFRNPGTTLLPTKNPVPPHLQVNWPESKNVFPNFMPEDKIVRINGVQLPVRDGFQSPLDFELNSILHPIFDETVKVTVERIVATETKASGHESDEPLTTEVEVEWKPIPMRTLGIAFEPGAVVAIQPQSAAEQAGVKLGDTLESLNDEPTTNAFVLPMMVAKLKGKTVTLKMRRPGTSTDSGEVYSFEWTVPDKFTLQDSGFQFNPVGLELPGSGLVYGATSIVASAKPSGDDSGKSLILPGETVLNVRLDSTNDEAVMQAVKKILSPGAIKQLLLGRELKDGYTSYYLNSLVQQLPLGTKLKLDFMREGAVESVNVVVSNDRDWNWFDRGIEFQPARLIRKAEDLPEAFALGWSEIKDKGSDVLRFLRMVFTWKIPYDAAGGPGMIFYAATSAASEGTTKLLMFLTMLSANLAIINFLPIPALDGGHMMFLIAEAIRGKPVNEALQMKLTLAGVLALLSLMVFVICNDIMNFTKLFGM